MVDDAAGQASFHQGTAAGGDIEHCLHLEFVKESIPKCDGFGLLPKQRRVQAMLVLPVFWRRRVPEEMDPDFRV